MYAHAFLPPDPKISSVPVLPVDNRLKKLGNAGIGTAPAENHVLLLEDEPIIAAGMDWSGNSRRSPSTATPASSLPDANAKQAAARR